MDPAAIVGRDVELAGLDEFVRGTGAPHTLVLVGAPGIGKTTLWEAALDRARDAGVRVLSTRGGLAEAKMSLTGIFDLADPVPSEVLAQLPAPQRVALEIALLRAEPGGRRATGPRILATALLSMLRTLAADGPVLVAIEDAQWVDASSQEALAFVLRRLEGSNVRVLLTVRDDAGAPVAEALEQEDAVRVQLTGLSLGATRRLLAQRLDLTLPRRLLLSVHAAARGNPLFALEIGRHLSERGSPHAGEPLPIPDDVSSLVGGRVAALPDATRTLLLAAALTAQPSTETLRAVSDAPLDEALEPAEREGVAHLRGDRVVFAHPLHAAAVVDGATTAERRRMHARLAGVVEALEERGRHIALAAGRQDEGAAATVHAAARDALSRGALIAAAELAELAVELSERDSPEYAERLLDLAAFLRLAGEPERGYAVLAGVTDWSSWPAALEARGRGQLLLATYWANGATAAADRGRTMLDEELDDQVRATVHTYLGGVSEFDLARSAVHISEALALLERSGASTDAGTLAHALAIRVRNGVLTGEGLDSTLLARVAELDRQLPPERFATEAMSPYLAILHKHVDDLSTSRERLELLLDEAIDTGNEVGATVARMHLALTELWAGDLAAAEAQLEPVQAQIDERGTRNVFLLAARALIGAHRGDVEAVRRDAAALEAQHGGAGAEVYGMYLAAGVGLLELSLGNAERADATFRTLLDALESGGYREPGIFRVHANAGEAAVAVGDLARAEEIARSLAAHADRTGHRWSRASSERVLALVAAARGDTDEARAHARLARDEYAELGMPFERARATLVAGVIERRGRRRSSARELLEESVREFERLGARLWADRARAELGSVSGRAPRIAGELTPAELRVVELAADGLANKEIAARLFVTVHTVELHLSHAYAKLGVRSRAQLAVRLGRRTPAKD